MGLSGGSQKQKQAAQTPLAQSAVSAKPKVQCRNAPKLKVKITRKDTGNPVGQVNVSASTGSPSPPVPSATDSGIADFGEIKPGTYTLEVSLPNDLRGKFTPPPPLPGQKLEKGDDKTIPMEIVPVVKLRVVLIDRADQAIQRAVWQLSSPSKNGTTGADGLVEVDISQVAEDLDQTELAVTLPAPPPVAVAPAPPPGAPPPPYPPPIAPAQFKDEAPVAIERQWKFKLSLVEIEKGDLGEDGVKARLVNLAFAPGDDAKTTTAVRAYQRLYKKTVTGAIADIKSDIKGRHDNP